MSRRVSDSLAVRIEEGTGRAALPGRNHSNVRAVNIHREDLIAAICSVSRLKYQLLPVAREISFGVLTAKCELFDVAQMFLFRESKWIVHTFRGRQAQSQCRDCYQNKNCERDSHCSSKVRKTARE